MMVMNHFFHALKEWIADMEDPRNQSYITYTQADLNNMAILKNVCAQHSMREMDENFDCLCELRKKMVTSLIRGKQFNRGRLSGKYWRIILDGTGLFYFKEKHCENCLCTTKEMDDGKTVKLYYHKVLEAKIVLSDHVVISLGTEFIENEKENVSKQDCETNAAKRLLKRIKKDYPRLPICTQGDALYATEPMMKLCRKRYHWEYLFTQKDTRQKKLDEGFEWIKSGEGAGRRTGLCKEKGTDFYANHMEEVAGKTEVMNVSSGLLESFRRQTVTQEDVSYIFRYTTVYLE